MKVVDKNGKVILEVNRSPITEQGWERHLFHKKKRVRKRNKVVSKKNTILSIRK